MLGKIPATRLRLIERIVRHAESVLANSDVPWLVALRGRLGRRTAHLTATFLRHYYRGVAEDDLRARRPDALVYAALAQLHSGLTRASGRPWVRVYNPEPARDGFSSPYTIVEVICEDMPFLVDSLGMVLTQAGLALQFLVHPVLTVQRDGRGRLLEIVDSSEKALGLESWQRYEIDRESDLQVLETLTLRLRATLADVSATVADWAPMRQRAREVAAHLESVGGGLPSGEVGEARDLLMWMDDNHFTFLGYRYYRLKRGRASDRLLPDRASGLGILRRAPGTSAPVPAVLTGAARRQARDREVLLITKANSLATVHRPTYLDYVGVKTYDGRGRVTGEHRFLGLWTSSAYSLTPREIPVLRHKVTSVIGHFGLAPTSHDGKAVLHVLENFPRDELFQASVADLIRIVRGVVNLYERQRVRLFLRRDAFRRFYSCFVYVPRDRYNTEVRQRIETVVREALHGTTIDSQVQLSESLLARVHLIVRTDPAQLHNPEPRIDAAAIEQRIAAAVRTWADGLLDALKGRHGDSAARKLYAAYARAVPAAYEEDTPAKAAVIDFDEIAALAPGVDAFRLRLYRPEGAPASKVQMKLYRRERPLPISDVLPSLENLGLKLIGERPYELRLDQSRLIWIQDFELEQPRGIAIDLVSDGPRVRETLTAVWHGQTENDGFNRLVLAADLGWRECLVLRAYCRWLLQTGIPFSQVYMESVLADNAATAGRLVRLFLAAFDPAFAARPREAECARLKRAINDDLARVTRLDEDRILRSFLATMDATLRTNYFQPAANGQPKGYFAIKLDPAQVPDLPEPRPMFEIWVYSPRVEAVHLRKGHVARGGIRWSDRREDFRTEVLGLMKAQNVKNTVIVPVGAKGGFVCKRLPNAREAIAAEVVACYSDFMHALLDITDNIVRGATVPPRDCVRRDGDDPYLVVAADKGTATFSDIANAIAIEHNFWLGDAFASGGSAGYDHKKIAITSRGAWESVKRHFRELGRNVDLEPCTVAGIGDMSGDVFGNGLLRSKYMKLVAAFNHQHIFIDPNPFAARSYAERLRLFRLPRSSWEDYDRKALSPGGGIWSRQDKALRLSREARTLLELSAETATPNEVIRAILRLPVDLMWNGGIGTYVKASDESNADVGDRANDALRICGRELRARVVGEGGNLGLSQRGRVEYALGGGRLNTDFIDNSGGVNCSDLEVNIKIQLGVAIADHRLRRPARDRLLAAMTDEVSDLVLRNNYLQSQTISLLEAHAMDRGPEYAYAIRMLERSGELDRALEFLPSEEALKDRRKQGRGLTRPELSLLLAYSKIWLYNQLIHSDVPEDRYLSSELDRYFPEQVRSRYGDLLGRHPLKREIIATATTNSLVNRMGPVFALRTQEDTGAGVGAIARAYAIAREGTAMRDVWADIEALDNKVPASVQYELHYETSRTLRQATYWVLGRRGADLDVEKAVARLKPGLAQLLGEAHSLIHGRLAQRIRASDHRYVKAGVPARLAARVAMLELVQSGLDIVDLAAAKRLPITAVAQCYLHLGQALDLDWLRMQIESLQVDGHWQAVARGTLRDNFYTLYRNLTQSVTDGRLRGGAARAADGWLAHRAPAVDALKHHFAEMAAAGVGDFATMSVALQSLRRLVDQQ
jgi:glutamate dehydrogenase